MNYNKMTEAELLERRTELVQIREGFALKPEGMHDSEIEDEIKKVDEQLKRFE